MMTGLFPAVASTSVEEMARRSASALVPGVPSVVTSVMRKRRLLIIAPVLLVKRRRIVSVPNAPFGIVPPSRTRAQPLAAAPNPAHAGSSVRRVVRRVGVAQVGGDARAENKRAR